MDCRIEREVAAGSHGHGERPPRRLEQRSRRRCEEDADPAASASSCRTPAGGGGRCEAASGGGVCGGGGGFGQIRHIADSPPARAAKSAAALRYGDVDLLVGLCSPPPQPPTAGRPGVGEADESDDTLALLLKYTHVVGPS